MSCILTIDDRPINRQFLVSLLGYGGHTVLEAAGGEEGLEIVRRSHPDLVIADIKMPKMDGYQFVERLREEEAIAATPVIFYTASYHEGEARGVAEFYGVLDIITKPSEPEAILEKVSKALGIRGPLIPPAPVQTDAADREMQILQATGLKLSALVELGMEFGSDRDPQRLLSRFCSTARHIIGSRKSMLGILSDSGDDLEYFLINGLKDAHPVVWERPPLHHSVLETIVKTKKAVRINHAGVDAHLEQLSPYKSPIKSFLGVPLMSATEVYGWLVLLEKQNDEEFSPEDERMATTLAAQAAIAFENALLSTRLQRNADELDRTRLEQLEMKDEFISHVSHELRSPLAAVHQFTTILLDGLAGELNGEQREYLEIVSRNSLQLRDMIADLLEVTRAQSGKLTIKPEPTSIHDLFRHLIQTYERRAAEKGIGFRISSQPNLPLVHADPSRLVQVLSNLLENALKFTSRGEVFLSACLDEDDKFVSIAVTDTGCGITADALPQIFDRLYQSPNTVVLSRKGLGLGLHICQHLVELHGGRIWADSKEGQGTTIFFTVPVSTAEEMVAAG
ncbi:MAG: two-component system, cell cycle sensor histidine kinase and response regulator CckA [Blastocatellia bacterium]|jgi:signal transduction histidine kinase/DNA-binding response OmpR family regulator|nr:two-component system, cell cycle sensor histidine kinase and response regulator CckA [Blastocatellia bacterium]